MSIDLSERAYAMDTADKLLVVGTADRKIHVIDLNTPGSIYRVCCCYTGSVKQS